MSALIVCSSSAHGNTRRIADAIAEGVDGVDPGGDTRVITPEEVDADSLDAAALVGFGSGIYLQRFAPELRRVVADLPARARGTAFVFSTSGLPDLPGVGCVARLERSAASRGFRVIPGFHCRGLDDWGPFGLIGGVNHGRPNADDVRAAVQFGSTLRA